MKRTALKRGGPLRKVSDKRAAENRARVTTMKFVAKRSGGKCEACPSIALVDPAAASNCQGKAVDGHEILTRARGGSITDPRNILHVCRRGHEWITAHPVEAEGVGLVRNSWDA